MHTVNLGILQWLNAAVIYTLIDYNELGELAAPRLKLRAKDQHHWPTS